MPKKCRICRCRLEEPLLEMNNIPAAAQRLPADEAEAEADKPVDLKLYSCPACGVLQHVLDPVPYYREVLRASGVSEAMQEFRREQFNDWLGRCNLKGGRILEAGCGRGEYLRIMESCGVQVCGMEYGDEAAELCRRNGIDLWQEFFSTGEETHPQGGFDGFYILNFLEHIPDIPAYLRGISRNLKPGAAGLVEVPNLDMILANDMLTEFSTEHIFYFTAAALKNTLESNGFEVRSCRSIWQDYILSAEVVKRSAPDLSGCAAVKARITRQLEYFIGENGQTAFWGAGHQALTALALAGMTREKVPFVVDSSPEKQGRFTYATHIPIVPPEALYDERVNAIVICCGGYSNEVLDIVSSRFSHIQAVAVLGEKGLEIL